MKALLGCICLTLLTACADDRSPPPVNARVAEWSVRLPLWRRFGLDLSVPAAIRLATAPLGARLLDGRELQTRWGRVIVTRLGEGVSLRCAPCTLHAPAISGNALHFAALQLQLTRHGRELTGKVQIDQLALRFAGELSDVSLTGSFELDETPIRDIYALFGAAIPELQRAEITGRAAASGTFSLPEGALTLAAQVRGFEVRGLGTEQLASGRIVHSCAGFGGTVRLRDIGAGGRDGMTLKAMGKLLPRAVIASEDMRYFKHPGYDLEEARAALDINFAIQGIRRGGSTITQQLARNLFLGQERTLLRKLRETLYAVEMEQTLGKERILALYLNTVDWGPGICGAKEAAAVYFGKSPATLRTEQVAWLAAILRNPHAAWQEEYLAGSPKMERVAWVVGRMRGLHRGERTVALQRPLRFQPPPARPPRKAERRLSAACDQVC
jgi:hypothetical protein